MLGERLVAAPHEAEELAGADVAARVGVQRLPEPLQRVRVCVVREGVCGEGVGEGGGSVGSGELAGGMERSPPEGNF